MSNKQEIELVNRIISVIENNPKLTWEQIYNGCKGVLNASTKNRYSLNNEILLIIQNMFLGYESTYFLGFKQAKELGLKMIKGSKGSKIYFYSPVMKDAEGNTTKNSDDAVEKYCFKKIKTVFSFDCFENDNTKKELIGKLNGVTRNNPNINEIDIDFDRFLAKTNIKLEIDNEATPSYNPRLDRIKMPEISQFKTSQDFYTTFLHEIAHSTGHERRLKRLKKERTKDSYAKEELIAELSSTLIAKEYNILNDDNIKNSSAYLKNWLDVIKEKPNFLMTVSSASEKVVNYYFDAIN